MRATLDKVEIREPVLFESEGQRIFGILHRPTLAENPPVVVMVHGFASSKHGSNRCYVQVAEQLAKEGIASLRFDFRGSGDSEGHLSDLSFENLVDDAEVVIDSLDKIEGIDSRRVGVFGASLGGAISLLAAARSGRVKTLALWAAVASGELWYRDFLKNHPEYIHIDPSKVMTTYRGITLSEAFKRQFQKMAAYKLSNLEDVSILMMHGEKDQIVSISHHEAFKQTFADSKNRFIKYSDGEHSLGVSPYFPQVIEELKLWFQQNL